MDLMHKKTKRSRIIRRSGRAPFSIQPEDTLPIIPPPPSRSTTAKHPHQILPSTCSPKAPASRFPKAPTSRFLNGSHEPPPLKFTTAARSRRPPDTEEQPFRPTADRDLCYRPAARHNLHRADSNQRGKYWHFPRRTPPAPKALFWSRARSLRDYRSGCRWRPHTKTSLTQRRRWHGGN